MVLEEPQRAVSGQVKSEQESLWLSFVRLVADGSLSGSGHALSVDCSG